jgi:RNA-directed DNA polymerase
VRKPSIFPADRFWSSARMANRKGPWRLSRTLATQSGMTNQWLKDQGLLSVKDLWVNIHYPATAR